jgi:hypothetical protein
MSKFRPETALKERAHKYVQEKKILKTRVHGNKEKGGDRLKEGKNLF